MAVFSTDIANDGDEFMPASQPIGASLWEELRPGYVYLWRRLTEGTHEDSGDRPDTILLAFFLFTFVPWLPFIWFAHVVRVLLRMMMR